MVITRRIFKLVVFSSDFSGIFGIDNTDGSRKVAKCGRIGQIEYFRVIVGQNPGKDGVLRQIVVRPAGDGIQLHNKSENVTLSHSTKLYG